jgi:hypothetical protein
MRLLYSLLAAAVVAMVALTACNSTNTQPGTANSRNGSLAGAPLSSPAGPKAAATPVHGDGVKRLTKDELREELAKGTAIVVDVRPAVSYQTSHIKGAIHIPLEQVGARSGELPRDKMIVTYCS